MKNTKTKIHYAFVILVACCILNGAAVGLCLNCTGVFYSYAAEDIGCKVSDIALYLSIARMLECASMVILVKRIVLKYPLRIVLLISSLLLSSRILLTFSTASWQWWAVAVLSGPSIALLDCFAATLMLERWFKKKLPLMLSIMASFSGIFTIAFSPIIGAMIQAHGWRQSWLVINIILLACTSIPSLFVSLDPSEKGLRPYGDDESAPIQKAIREEKTGSIKLERNLILIFVIAIANAAAVAFVSSLTVYAQSINVTAYAPALLVTSYAIGNISFKLLFGVIAERFGVKKASVFIFVMTIAGTVLIMTKAQYVVFVGGVLFGANAAIYTTVLPMLNKHTYGDRYATAVQYTAVFYSIMIACLNYLQPLVFDLTGSFNLDLIVLLVLLVIGIVIIDLLFKSKKDNRQAS